MWYNVYNKDSKNFALPVNLRMKLSCDIKAATSITHNLMQHDWTKLMKIDRHSTKGKIDDNVSHLFQPLNSLHTSLPTELVRPNFKLLLSMLVMIDIYSPTWEGVKIALSWTSRSVLSNISHEGIMADISGGFWACRNGKY